MKESGLDIERLQKASVLVVGDVMLDIFVYGSVTRISAEAPIPILTVKEEVKMPGGAANVALNVSALGARVAVIGVIGADRAGEDLSELICSISYPVTADFVVDPDRCTTSKTRYIGNKQQILRSDRETTASAGPEIEDELLARIYGRIRDAHVVALSDYGKGVLTDRVLTEILRMCRRTGIPAIIDPKRSNWEIYRGASVIKPNLQELVRATGLDCTNEKIIEQAADKIIADLNVEILLTRSQDGMSLFRAGHRPEHTLASGYEVYDVSGAGDTALATFSSAIGAGSDMVTAMRIANVAAGIVVTKLGTAVVTFDELARACLDGEPHLPVEKVVSREVAAAICRNWKAQGLHVGFTNGCFDLVHAGHVSLLAKAASRCDRLVIALNSDASVRRLKGQGRPIQNESSRAQVTAALHAASLVTIFDEETPYELIELLKPDILFKGADYSEDEVIGGELVKLWGGKVELIELVEGLSTTKAIKRAKGAE
jgi:D-beta-D-heptose 7-phosphate kinase/D-beta-D-heptose 1-phosphate adenosyltransferase